MFRGHFEHTVDEKGRVAIPARFREVLSGLQEERLVVTKYAIQGKRCLDAYPFGAWRQLEVRLQARRRFEPKLVNLRNYYVSGAYECQLDGQGRILLPQYLREYATIGRETVFTGDIDKFRIWDKDTWQQTFAAHEQEFTENPDLWSDLD